MSLEEEMHHEAARLEREMEDIDLQLKKLYDKIFALLSLYEKKGRDLKTLKDSFVENYIEKETNKMIEDIMKGKQSARA